MVQLSPNTCFTCSATPVPVQRSTSNGTWNCRPCTIRARFARLVRAAEVFGGDAIVQAAKFSVYGRLAAGIVPLDAAACLQASAAWLELGDPSARPYVLAWRTASVIIRQYERACVTDAGRESVSA